MLPDAAPLLHPEPLERAEAFDPQHPRIAYVDEAGEELECELGVFGDAVDTLLGLVEAHPDAAASFLRGALLLGLATGSLLPAPCAAFLASAWEPCGECSRPLRLWVLVRCGLYLLKATACLHLYLKLGRSPDVRGVQQVISSCAWKFCRGLSTAGHAWLFMGLALLMNGDFQGQCRGLVGLTCGLVILALVESLVKPILAMGAFRSIVLARLQPAGGAPDGAPRGACQELMRSLPLGQFTAGDFRETSCAICLGDFEGSESLRQLPCRHKFHAPCVDKWLAKDGRCPLCMHEVGAARPSRARAGLGC